MANFRNFKRFYLLPHFQFNYPYFKINKILIKDALDRQDALCRINTKYSLNEIPNYIPTARNIPEDTKQEIIENKSSKYNGVSYDSIRKHYVVSIKFNNKSYHLGHNESEIECAKLYNQQALYYNENFDSKYELNELGPEYEIIAKNVYKELQDNKLNRKTSQYVGCII